MSADTVVIKSPVSGPDAPEATEEEAVESQPSEASGEEEAVEEEEEAVEALEDDSERPEWLPEKFKNPEDLAKAYGELEKKMGEPSEEGDEAAPSKEAMSLESLNKYSEEFNEKGELSEDSYSDLEKLGLN